MFKRLTTAAAALILLSACAGGPPPEPPAPPPLDPTGTYDITVDAEGMTITGIMSISGSAEAGYTGSVDTDMGGAGLSSIVVEGQTVTCSIPDAQVDLEMVFEGDGFTGVMNGAMGQGGIIGKKRPKK